MSHGNGSLSYIFLAGIACVLLIFPLIATVINLTNLIAALLGKPLKEKIFTISDYFSVIVGAIYIVLLFLYSDFKDYTVALPYADDLHAPVALAYLSTVSVLLLIGIMGYAVLRARGIKLPPLLIVILYSFMLTGILISILCLIQLSSQLSKQQDGVNIATAFYFMLYFFNFILCSITLMLKTLLDYRKEQPVHEKQYKNKLLQGLACTLEDSANWKWFTLIFLVPLIYIAMLILLLFGQQPDSIIKAFTETCDWTLSKHIAPPPIGRDDCYICTAALKGHKKFVKPIRCGLRRGEKIPVNRQLLVANAFEELLQQKTPALHKVIRSLYDKYGFAIARRIKTARQADLAYGLMKPLEWSFLIILYLTQLKPENKIAVQYLPIREGRG